MTSSFTGYIALNFGNRAFLTNGEQLNGELVLQSNHEKLTIYTVQASLLCEEWVHTVHLEFREHYRNTHTILSAKAESLHLNENETIHLPFTLTIPTNEKGRKYPPSFEYMYNNVVWSIKCSLGYRVADSKELQSTQIEQPFKLCSKSAHNIQSSTDLQKPVLNEFKWMVDSKNCNSVSLNSSDGPNPIHIPANNPNLTQMTIQFVLKIPHHGLLQTCTEDVLSKGMTLAAHLNGIEVLELRELDIQVIEQIHTYGKDTLFIEKSIMTEKFKMLLHLGYNNLDQLVKELRVHDLSEDFKTEWLQVNHILRLTFIFNEPKSSEQFELAWNVPTFILSEAEFLNVNIDTNDADVKLIEKA